MSASLDSRAKPAETLLLSELEIKASLFHIGQYCDQWEASLSAHHQACFHLVLHGPCWLHMPNLPAQEIKAGDAVFFLRPMPHRLTPIADPPHALAAHAAMQNLDASVPHTTGLLCGFLNVGTGLSELLIADFPDILYLRQAHKNSATLTKIYELIQLEIADEPNAQVLQKLIELLLFYALRHHTIDNPHNGHGLLQLAKDAQFGPLLTALMAQPEKPWSVDDMALFLNMSRAAFHRRFTLLSGLAPAQVLLHIRLQLAKKELLKGSSIEQIAEQVGYGSASALSHAFRRATGLTPAAWRMAQKQ